MKFGREIISGCGGTKPKDGSPRSHNYLSFIESVGAVKNFKYMEPPFGTRCQHVVKLSNRDSRQGNSVKRAYIKR